MLKINSDLNVKKKASHFLLCPVSFCYVYTPTWGPLHAPGHANAGPSLCHQRSELMASTSHVGPAANSPFDPLLVSTYINDNTDICDSEFHMRLQAYRAIHHFRYNTNNEQNHLLDVMLSSLDIFVLIFQLD